MCQKFFKFYKIADEASIVYELLCWEKELHSKMLFDVKINDLTLLITEDTLQKSVYLETLL